jgi:hypothetical protein
MGQGWKEQRDEGECHWLKMPVAWSGIWALEVREVDGIKSCFFDFLPILYVLGAGQDLFKWDLSKKGRMTPRFSISSFSGRWYHLLDSTLYSEGEVSLGKENQSSILSC